MRELNDKGFLKYEPSFNPYKGSMVHLIDFSAIEPPYKKQPQKILNQKEKNKIAPLFSSPASICKTILTPT